jgi:CyaY protein
MAVSVAVAARKRHNGSIEEWEARGYPMLETDFHGAVDALFARIEALLDDAYEDIDYDTVEGVMTLTGPQGKIILSRQPPLAEVWIAARSGGFHFRRQAQTWVDTRDGMALEDRLTVLLAAALGP